MFAMKKLAYVGLAAVVLVAPARAADIPVKAPPAPVVLPFNWNGFYAGGHFGGGQLNDTVTFVGTLNSINFPAGTVANEKAGGLLGGVQAGYNWQLPSNWVLGVEGEYSFTNFTASNNIGPNGSGSAGSNAIVSVVNPNIVSFPDPRVTDLAAITGRFGYAFDRVLFYGKAGWAWARTSDNAVTTNILTGVPILSQTLSATRSGWTAGGGVEFGFWHNWSIKLEGDYMGFGKRTLGSLVTSGDAAIPTGSILLREHDTNIWVVKAGFNYHFNWGAAPLVANY
jgi:outer membrane immunogenic protein